MTPFVTGISFKTAPVSLREQLAVSPWRVQCLGCELKVAGGLLEVVLLSTCNRVEIYGVASDPSRVENLINTLARDGADVRPYAYVLHGEEAVRHLFSVTSGLESMVLGETEITGQVKNAYEAAQKLKLTGRVANCLFQKALQAAKAVRTQTQVGRGATSVGSVAVQLAEKIFDRQLEKKDILILGAGQMGEACVRHLAKKGVHSITVANRSIDRAQKLAEEFGGHAVGLEACRSAIAEADIVVAAAGGDTLVSRKDVEIIMQQRRSRPLFFIDIAVPRNIDPDVQSVENVYLYNVDHLEEIVLENVRLREQELARCRAIVEESVTELMAKLQSAHTKPKPASPTLSAPPGWVLSALTSCTNFPTKKQFLTAGAENRS